MTDRWCVFLRDLLVFDSDDEQQAAALETRLSLLYPGEVVLRVPRALSLPPSRRIIRQ